MRSIVLCLLVAICISMSFGDFDYTISNTYLDDTLILNSESLQVNDEGVYEIIANGASYVEITNTSAYDPYAPHAGGIRSLELNGTSVANISGGDLNGIFIDDTSVLNISGGNAGVDAGSNGNSAINMSGGTTGSFFVQDSSTLSFSGGELRWLGIYHDATAVFSGGDIENISCRQYSDITKHITFICNVESVIYNESTNLLTGYWLDGSEFSVTLQDISGYDSAYSNINFIVPEPATLALFGLGGLLIRKRKQ